jgi:hypothetical protein
MSLPPPPDRHDPPTEPLRPVEPPPVVREREQVVDRMVEPGPDPALMYAQLDERLRSMRNALALLGLLATAALAIALLAMLQADDAERNDSTGASRERVERLDQRVDELRQDLDSRTKGTADSSDVNDVQEALDEKADAKDVTALEKAVQDLGDQPAESAEPDAATTQAIEDLSTRLDELEQQVAEQQQSP